MTPTENTQIGGSRAASAVNILAGIWLFVSPWVYGAYGAANAWNSWIVGAVIAIFAVIQYNNPLGLKLLSWINCVLGIWTFCSPWIYGYTGNTGRFINSLCVGVIVFLLAIRAASSSIRMQQPTPHRM